MDLIAGYLTQSATMIAAFLFVLTIVVFFHELGHFLVARWCGVRVDAFSVGFGKELAGFYDRHGTRWKVCLIPLGGYVKFAGDDNAASMPDRERIAAMSDGERAGIFAAKPVWQRASVVAAGPIANFLLSIVIFALVFGLYGRVVTSPTIDTVQPGSAAEQAGLLPGDLVLAVDGKPVATFSDLQRIVTASADIPLALDVERGSEVVRVVVTPQHKEISDGFGGTQRVGLLGVTRSPQQEDLVRLHYGPVEAVGEGMRETWFIMERTVDYLVKVVTGRESADQLGGPIRVAQVSGQVAELGIVPLLQLAAVLSVSIGLLNLMPIPMLDGGHLVYYAAEAVRGKPLSERVQDVGFRIGIAVVLMLMVFATWNDVSRIAGG
ncbi:RIP metalloprotease RseP [Microvirga tunisiensis]|uniref:Zinc metalloprotease n=2 Tax=Pannonibacter tanglangensis TaxID=2750084 RepID=A0A7X5F1U7_9HYPH|nr:MULTISPECIES: RIP metalloprotease RseP [unclassified Pannonibacter]NBN62308.1 RIP metalloprotease RseP [Pannonibacter sp. XCT-34]NBN77974.1 RIP metalloprotease RseP [Pannonibacter sp. XCT-53]